MDGCKDGQGVSGEGKGCRSSGVVQLSKPSLRNENAKEGTYACTAVGNEGSKAQTSLEMWLEQRGGETETTAHAHVLDFHSTAAGIRPYVWPGRATRQHAA